MGFYDLEPDGTSDTTQPFGFHIDRPDPPRNAYTDRGSGVPENCWAIGLPHQCDDWAIAMSPDRQQVLAEARRFRDELDAAIRELEDQ